MNTKQTSRWIEIIPGGGMPRDREVVLIAHDVGGYVGEARFHDSVGVKFFSSVHDDSMIAAVAPTHWMQLPAPPNPKWRESKSGR